MLTRSFALAGLCAAPALAQGFFPGMTTVMNDDARTVWGAMLAMGVQPEAGPGGPVDTALLVNELACEKAAGEPAEVRCRAVTEAGELVSDDAVALRAAVDVLLRATGRATAFRVTNLQCYRNSLPVGNAICGMTGGQ